MLFRSRLGDQWRLREPVDALADADQTRQILSLLANLRYSRVLEMTAESAREYGLDPAVGTINFSTRAGRHTLVVGAAGGLSTQRFSYVTKPGESKAYLVDAEVNDLATADVQAYRSRELVTVDAGWIAAIRLVNRDAAVGLRRVEGRWRIIEPVRMPADGEAAEALVRAVKGLGIVHFVSDEGTATAGEEDEASVRYGFDAPQLAIELFDVRAAGLRYPQEGLEGEVNLDASSNGEGLSAERSAVDDGALRIEFGRHGDMGSVVYARVLPYRAVYTVTDEAYRSVAKRLDDMRGRRLAAINEAALRQLKIDIDGVSVTLEQQRGQWQLGDGEGARVESGELQRLLKSLGEITYRSYSDGAARGQAELGLDNPRGSISWRHEYERESQIVLLGRPVGGRQWTLASGSDVAGAVDVAAIDSLKRSRLGLHDRTVWEVGAGERVTKIQWKLGDQTVVVERGENGESAWRMTGPIEMAVDVERMEALLEAVSRLRADSFAGLAGSAIDYNLDEPGLQLTLWTRGAAGEQGRQISLVASHKDGHWFGMGAQVPLVFVLPDAFVQALEQIGRAHV